MESVGLILPIRNYLCRQDVGRVCVLTLRIKNEHPVFCTECPILLLYSNYSLFNYQNLPALAASSTETVTPYFNGFSRFLLATSMLRIHFCIILYSFNHVILYKKKSPHSSAGSCMIVRTFSYLRDIFNVPDSTSSVTYYRAR